MRRRLNVKFLAGLLAVAVLVGGGLYLLYHWQVRRHSDALLAQVERAETAGDLERARQRLERYLVLQPGDGQARARYAMLLARQADTPPTRGRALTALEQVLLHHPQRDDVRRWHVRLALDLGAYDKARADLNILLERNPQDGEAEEQLARCESAASRWDSTETWLRRAIDHAPQRIDSYVRLAALYRGSLNKPEQGDAVIDALVAANPRSAPAYVAHARYRHEYHRSADAANDLAEARTLAPDDSEVLQVSGQLAVSLGNLDEARGYFQRGLERYPNQLPFYMLLAAVEQQAGRHTEAITLLRHGLQNVKEADRYELLVTLLDFFVQGNEWANAEETLALLRQSGTSPVLSFHEARLFMRQGHWHEAIALLQAVRTQLSAAPDLGVSVELLLSECYAKIGNLDQQLEAARRAVALDATSAAARFGLGSVLLARGRRADAVNELRQMAKLSKPPASGGTLLARALIEHNCTLAESERDWKEVAAVLDRAATAAPTSPEVAILRAQALAAQGMKEQVTALLEQACQQQPREPALWVARSEWAERQQGPEAADAILATAHQKLGDRVELSLARLRAATRRASKETRAVLEAEEQRLGNYGTADREQLLSGLADAYLEIGDWTAAERLLRRLAEAQPDNLGVRVLLFDLAIQTGRGEALAPLRDDIKRLEGEDGIWWRYAEAARCLALAAQGKGDYLERAVKGLQEIASREPGWLRLTTLRAQIQELQGDAEQALATYQLAVERGDRQPAVIQKVVRLLYERQRYREADELLRRLQGSGALAARLDPLVAEVALKNNDWQRALAAARRAVADQPKDYQAQVWLGLSLWASGSREEAEAAFEEAVALAPDVAEPRVSLVYFLIGTDQKAKAEAAVAEAQRHLPADRAPLPLAQCYEALAMPDKAEQQYQTALTRSPDDATVLRAVAAFYLRRAQVAKAEPPLRKLIAHPERATAPDVAWARRNFAVALAVQGNYKQYNEALALIDRNRPPKGEEPFEDRRARALVMATRACGHREAIQLLEEVGRHQTLSAEDQFLLAQLYAGLGKERDADRWMDTLLTTCGPTAPYLAYVARGKLRGKDLAGARSCLEKLEKLYPETWETVDVSARLFQAANNDCDAVYVIQKHLDERGSAKTAEDTRRAAALLEELAELDAAEELYRDLAKSDRPESQLLLIAFLGRQQRVHEALDLCEKAWSACPPETVAGLCIGLLRAQEPTAKQVERVDKWVEAATKAYPRSVPLQLSLADIRELQERYADAEALYRHVLEQEPDNVRALNNLAWQLALRGHKSNEAIKLSNRAIELFGPEAQLLDTRAVAYVAAGKGDLAVKDLDAALALEPAAVFYFHYARAKRLTSSASAARAAFETARNRGLTERALHPLERPAYRELLADEESK